MAPQRVDYHWVRNELLPFLTALFDPEESNASKTTEQYWEDEVRRAESRINTIVRFATYTNSYFRVLSRFPAQLR